MAIQQVKEIVLCIDTHMCENGSGIWIIYEFSTYIISGFHTSPSGWCY